MLMKSVMCRTLATKLLGRKKKVMMMMEKNENQRKYEKNTKMIQMFDVLLRVLYSTFVSFTYSMVRDVFLNRKPMNSEPEFEKKRSVLLKSSASPSNPVRGKRRNEKKNHTHLFDIPKES